METDYFINAKIFQKSPPENVLAGAEEIAIRDAEIHGTKLIIQTNGKIEELTPDEMRARLRGAQ